VSKIDPDTNSVITTVSTSTGGDPYGIAFDGKNVWVTNWGSHTIFKIGYSNNHSTGV